MTIFLLLGARFWIPRRNGFTVTIAINQHLPVLTSAIIGTSLSIVITTLLLPVWFLYLRSNTTSIQSWQIEEVSAASRLVISAGRFLGDVSILLMFLCALCLAGWISAWILLLGNQVHLGEIAVPLLLGGGPALAGVAAIRLLVDAAATTRRALGEVCFLVLWLVSLSTPFVKDDNHSKFHVYLIDFSGCVQPLMHFAHTSPDISIGFGMPVLQGETSVDVMGAFKSSEYIVARLVWALGAVGVVMLAGVVYKQHKTSGQIASMKSAIPWLSPSVPPKPTQPITIPEYNRHPWFGVCTAQMKIMYARKVYVALGACIAIVGIFASYRYVTSSLIALVQIFIVTTWAGTAESRGLGLLTSTTVANSAMRRLVFIAGGIVSTFIISIPALFVYPSIYNLGIAVGVGVAITAVAIAVTMISRSAFAARLILLVVWYGYISA